ncbi:MAG: hypothetical protein DI535_05980 [Citrobacter freundii]|nr:MAG: hypothetical protein DI535_05980 [Citrobacter freundii]
MLQSALGEGSPFTMLSEKQLGFIVLMLHRLQDAVWLLYITGSIPVPETEKETNHHAEFHPGKPTKPITHPHFFFITSTQKFVRMDLDHILCGIAMDDHAFLHTTNGFHKPTLTNDQLKELLPTDQFTWINKSIAVRRDLASQQ